MRVSSAAHHWQEQAGVLAARLAAVEAWGQQIHDALDGKPLPEHPDEAPARVAALRAERDEARGALTAETRSCDRWRAKANELATRAALARSTETEDVTPNSEFGI